MWETALGCFKEVGASLLVAPMLFALTWESPLSWLSLYYQAAEPHKETLRWSVQAELAFLPLTPGAAITVLTVQHQSGGKNLLGPTNLFFYSNRT